MKWDVVFIIVIVIVTAGLLVFNYWWLPKQETKQGQISNEALPKITKEEASDWQTFEVKEYGFSMQIPKDYTYDRFNKDESGLWVGRYKNEKEGSGVAFIFDKAPANGEKITKLMNFEYEWLLNNNSSMAGKKIADIQDIMEKNIPKELSVGWSNTLVGSLQYGTTIGGAYSTSDNEFLSIQKIEKQNCPTFIVTSKKTAESSDNLLPFRTDTVILPIYNDIVNFRIMFSNPQENDIEIEKMIQSIKCEKT